MSFDSINLNPQLRPEHQRILLRYLIDELTLSHHDWVTLVEAVDVLSESIVMTDGQAYTFRQFYEEYIDLPFADTFLSHLLTLTDVEVEGRRAQAATAQQIGRLLDQTAGFSRDDSACRLLLIYCLYWWAAFARGYIFEVVIFRDLEAAKIQFVAHDIRRPNERRAPYDLLLFDLRGDIKYTTYFLTAESLTKLRSDFFLTRWYLVHRREWLRVAVLRETAWRRLSLPPNDDERQITPFDEVANRLPNATAFTIDNIWLTALGYEHWKQRVWLKQTTKGEEQITHGKADD